jgi:hypothetical protein
LSHEKEVWKDVIMAKYGAVNVGVGNLGELQVSSRPLYGGVIFVCWIKTQIGLGKL